MTFLALLLSVASFVNIVVAITAIPTQSTTEADVVTSAAALAPTSYSFTYTVTTPTTTWHAPSFATSAPVSACSESMCPSLNGKSCVDPEGVIYGILCDIQFSGIVITNSGKKFLLERDEDMKQIEREETYGGKEKRDYAGEFNICAGFCDSFDAAYCVGLHYDRGYCMAYDTVTGTFNSTTGLAAIRKS